MDKYAENLLKAVFDVEEVTQIPKIELYNHACVTVLAEQYVTIRYSKKTSLMMRMRFNDGYTYRKIGEEFGLSPERPRQAIAKAIRIIKHPAGLKYIRDPQYNLDRIRELEYEIVSLTNQCKKHDDSDPIEYLELSTRTYNALRKKGIETIGELKQLTTSKELYNIRGIGEGCVKEIKHKLLPYTNTEEI